MKPQNKAAIYTLQCLTICEPPGSRPGAWPNRKAIVLLPLKKNAQYWLQGDCRSAIASIKDVYTAQ